MEYYTYAYLNQKTKRPYYVGKGKGYRRFQPHRHVSLPPNPENNIILKEGLTEDEAFRHEKYMISVFGRKSQGDGILLNITEGGDTGSTGLKQTEDHKRKMVETRIKNGSYKHTDEQKEKVSESLKKAYAEGRRKPSVGMKCAGWNKGKKKYDDGLTPQQRYVLRKKGLYPE